MKFYYKMSEISQKKLRPNYITVENCFLNFISIFPVQDTILIMDNCSRDTLKKFEWFPTIIETHFGNPADPHLFAIDHAIKNYIDSTEIYFCEADYIHHPDAYKILGEAFDLGVRFVSLYDHPDKYLDNQLTGNVNVEPLFNAFEERIFAQKSYIFSSRSCHWRTIDSTTGTYGTTVQILKNTRDIHYHYCKNQTIRDYELFNNLKLKFGMSNNLITPIPGYATHGELENLGKFRNWEEYIP